MVRKYRLHRRRYWQGFWTILQEEGDCDKNVNDEDNNNGDNGNGDGNNGNGDGNNDDDDGDDG